MAEELAKQFVAAGAKNVRRLIITRADKNSELIHKYTGRFNWKVHVCPMIGDIVYDPLIREPMELALYVKTTYACEIKLKIDEFRFI